MVGAYIPNLPRLVWKRPIDTSHSCICRANAGLISEHLMNLLQEKPSKLELLQFSVKDAEHWRKMPHFSLEELLPKIKPRGLIIIQITCSSLLGRARLPLPASHLTLYWFLENKKHQVCLAEIFHCKIRNRSPFRVALHCKTFSWLNNTCCILHLHLPQTYDVTVSVFHPSYISFPISLNFFPLIVCWCHAS